MISNYRVFFYEDGWAIQRSVRQNKWRFHVGLFRTEQEAKDYMKNVLKVKSFVLSESIDSMVENLGSWY